MVVTVVIRGKIFEFSFLVKLTLECFDDFRGRVLLKREAVNAIIIT